MNKFDTSNLISTVSEVAVQARKHRISWLSRFYDVWPGINGQSRDLLVSNGAPCEQLSINADRASGPEQRTDKT